jgi:cell division protein FtsQ
VAAESKKRRAVPARAIVRYGGIALLMCGVLAGAIYASQRFEQFLIRDPRFFLAAPADYGLESPNVQLEGVKYASRDAILRLFNDDYGRSVYLLPMAERRRALLNISWVRDASILRVWPDRAVVTIVERAPVAFVKVPAESITRWALIDAEGAILDPPHKAVFQLPVLTGIAASERTADRARRVRRMQQLMNDLGPLADNVSEVDAGDLDNLKIVAKMQGRAVTLMMGDRNFSGRLKHFLEHYSDIHRRMPRASAFDLRLDDRITGLEDSGNAR